MAAKPKKVATKKVRGKAPAKKAAARPGKVTAVELEVVATVPDLMPPEVSKQIDAVEKQLSQVGDMSGALLCNTVQHYAAQADRFARHAVRAGASTLVYAWASGKLLNAAKEKLGHGEFGRWRDANLVPAIISGRTATRYMQLATHCHDVRALLEWNPSLRQAYIACGILPDPSEADREEEEKEKPSAKQLLFTSLTHIQRDLRLFDQNIQKFESSKGKLSNF